LILEENQKENPLKFYARYSSLGIQMIVIILAGAFGGRELDNYLNREFPIFTVSLTILFTIGATIYGMRELFKKKK